MIYVLLQYHVYQDEPTIFGYTKDFEFAKKWRDKNWHYRDWTVAEEVV